MNTLRHDNEKVLLLLRDEIFQMFWLLINTYDDVPDILSMFHYQLIGEFSYVLYHRTKQKYVNVLLKSIEVSSPQFPEHPNDMYLNMCYDENDQQISLLDTTVVEVHDTVLEVANCLTYTFGRKATELETCAFINTETIISVVVNLVFGWFLGQDLISAKCPTDDSIINKIAKTTYDKYKYNCSVLANSIATMVSPLLKHCRFNFDLIVNTRFSPNNLVCPIETYCTPIPPTHRAIIIPGQ